MPRLQFVLVLCAGLLAATCPVVAGSYNVGSCKFPSFPDIQTAVDTVPTGSTVLVCPGSWAQQVIISTPLTLAGMTINNTEQTVITVPSGGLTTVSPPIGSSLAPQIIVNASPVNITNLIIDGTGYTCSGLESETGIYYATSSSGTTKGVEIRNEGCTGIGIAADNSSAAVNIASSYVHNVDGFGILERGNGGGTVQGNELTGSTYGISVIANGGVATVARNAVSGNVYGIIVAGNAQTLNNTVRNASLVGVTLNISSAPTTGNTILDTPTAISIINGSSGAVQSNFILNANVGIEFNCTSGVTVTKNAITSATTGLDQVPAAFVGINSIYNAGTVRNNGPC